MINAIVEQMYFVILSFGMSPDEDINVRMYLFAIVPFMVSLNPSCFASSSLMDSKSLFTGYLSPHLYHLEVPSLYLT